MDKAKPVIFVTGASGFIGGAIAKHLKENFTVYAMSRSPKSDEKIKALGVKPIRCSLDNIKSSDLSGCSIVIHSAAFVEPWGTKQQFWSANVAGTERLLQAAKEAGIKRFIHISSEAAVFHGKAMNNIDETEPYANKSPFYYCETKAAAEKLVLAANDPQHEFETMAIRPRLVWGPGDQTVLPEIISAVNKGVFMWIDKGRRITATTHIANLVHAVRLALDKGKSGEAYFVTDNKKISVKEFISQLLSTQNMRAPEKSIPGWLIRGIITVVDRTWKALRIKKAPPLAPFAVYIMSLDCIINIGKAEKALGYNPQITVEEGMAELKSAEG